MLTYDTPALRKTGSRNLTGQKMLPTIWGTYKKLVTKYQIPVIISCWEKCLENVHIQNVCSMCIKINSRQTGSRNLMCPKTLPTIWGTYMKLVTKYQIKIFNCIYHLYEEVIGYPINWFNPASFLCLSKARISCGPFLCSILNWEVIVRFVDISGIVDHQCLN
jgi:hypothetical protein